MANFVQNMIGALFCRNNSKIPQPQNYHYLLYQLKTSDDHVTAQIIPLKRQTVPTKSTQCTSVNYYDCVNGSLFRNTNDKHIIILPEM